MSSLLVVGDYIQELLANDGSLGLQDVWYGDQELIPRVPAISIEPNGVDSLLAGVPFMVENTLTFILMLYYGGVQDVQISKRDCIEYAQTVMDAMHADKTMGGNVIHGFCTSVEYGVATKGNALIFASRITWQGLTKTQL